VIHTCNRHFLTSSTSKLEYGEMARHPNKSTLPRLQQGQLNFSTRSTNAETRHTSTQPSTASSTPYTPTLSAESPLAPTVEDDLDNEEIRSFTASSDSKPPVSARKKRTSWVFKHTAGTDDMQKIFFNAEGRELALDILSIPAMSAEVERLFSATKLTITDLRTKLVLNVVEALLCLKSWYKLKSMRFIIEDILIGPAPNEEI
jgi:hypothetical protein